ncbi:MAG: cysteine desulfurase family protein [Vicinamibacterales bacterium]|jgi:cysteine desulfurase|nr:cysteine desulfurase NifS [Acidobacteriota bacterium]MDP7472469.1 cysteine desulfurase family protein [Vicinamibacterales bacterium]MDP7672535.1 cysteine desulfurase family protein [Vicinamibacterales bacterium]HJO37127.1 cysteine desulfurase family protein [Vicinamibacterales bacterium]
MRIYFDHNATTPLDPRVADAVAAALHDDFGNPSSVHHFGQRAKQLVDDARAAVATLIGAEPSEVIFTSGGTEADNLALRGVSDALAGQGRRHLIASAIEHEAVLNTLKALQLHGSRVTLLPVDARGIVSPDDLRAAIDDETCLVSVMHANNEIGTIQPIAKLAAITHDRGALFHTDAVQSVAKVPTEITTLGVDLLSLSAHKFNGPKGVGALWLRRGLRLSPTQTGGRHERSRRAGTENVPALVGMGVAARAAIDKLASTGTPLAPLRDRLEHGILGAVSGTTVNGAREPRVPNTSNISFEGVEAESLLIALDLEGIAVSTGSACSSGTLEPSHVLRAMGLPPHRVQSSIRFSLGLGNTEQEVDRTLAALPGIVGRLRDLTRASARSRTAASGAGR